MTSLSRRRVLQSSAAAIALGFGGLHRLFLATGHATPRPAHFSAGFGPLVADPAGVFDLPAGFSYVIVSRQGDPMSDGFVVPGRPDGMAAFPGPDGRTLIVRNHEVNPADSRTLGPFGPENVLLPNIDPARVYDMSRSLRLPALGGTTTILFDTATRQVIGQKLSLAGTLRNCAGGPTPWGTWLTCEETLQRADLRFARDHGWVFEVPAVWGDDILAVPTPYKAMGRFNHEAVAVDPASGAVYLTEDQGDGLLYRFLPAVPGQLAAGGRLQALALRARPSADTRNWAATSPWSGLVADGLLRVGEVLPVRWIDLADVEAPLDDLRHRGFAAGAARFARGEGMWWAGDSAFFACTNGGRAREGQIWRYVPSPAEGTPAEEAQPGLLELFLEPDDAGLIDNADNLTVAPWGDLFVCEDGGADQFLVGVTPEGGIYRFGRNAISTSELAGACFSPDGTTLFLNVQHSGITLAITGDWGTRA